MISLLILKGLISGLFSGLALAVSTNSNQVSVNVLIRVFAFIGAVGGPLVIFLVGQQEMSAKVPVWYVSFPWGVSVLGTFGGYYMVSYIAAKRSRQVTKRATTRQSAKIHKGIAIVSILIQ